MATTVNLNGVNYSVPAVGEGNWGTSLSLYLVALSTGVLQKAGGTFTLTADVDFGASYGLKASKFSSRSTPATAGLVRLGNNESIGWRNSTNTTNKELKVNASDLLEFDGNPLLTLALGAASTVLRMNAGGTAYEFAKIIDANVDAFAAIAQSKIANLTTDLAAKLDDVAVATDNALVRFDTNGQALQNSPVIVDDSGNMTGVANITTSGNIDKASNASLTIGATNATDIYIGRTGQITYFPGNVIVQGDYVYENVSDYRVEDKNILINKGGTSVGAAGAGLSVEGDAAAVIATILYDSTLASKWKVGAVGAESEIMTVATAQSVSGVKTFTDNLIIDNAKEIRFREATTNGTNYIGFKAPASLAGDVTFTLPTADGSSNQVLTTNGSGTLTWSTVAAGIGTNFDVYILSSADYTVLDNDGYRHIQVSTGASNRTITLPTAADNGDRMITITKTDSGVGTVIIDGEGAETIDGTATKKVSGQYSSMTLVCNGTSWQVIDITYSNREWAAYTPTLTLFGNGTANLIYKRLIDSIKIKGSLKVGSSLPTGVFTWSLPSGLTADYSKLTVGLTGIDAYQKVGVASSYLPEHFMGAIVRNNTSTTTFYVNGDGATYTTDGDWQAQIGGITLANGDTIQIEMEVPIVEWAE